MNHAGRGERRYAIEPTRGARIELVRTSDEHTALRPGDRGTVRIVDAIGTVHIAWDTGSSLGLVPGEDTWRFVREDGAIVHTDEGVHEAEAEAARLDQQLTEAEAEHKAESEKLTDDHGPEDVAVEQRMDVLAAKIRELDDRLGYRRAKRRPFRDLGLSDAEADEAIAEGMSADDVRDALMEQADEAMGPGVWAEIAESRETPHQRRQRHWGVG